MTHPARPVAGGDGGPGELCEVSVGRGRCGRRTVATVSVTCPDEHADTTRLCRAHTRDAQSGRMFCVACGRQGREDVFKQVTRVVWDR